MPVQGCSATAWLSWAAAHPPLPTTTVTNPPSPCTRAPAPHRRAWWRWAARPSVCPAGRPTRQTPWRATAAPPVWPSLSNSQRWPPPSKCCWVLVSRRGRTACAAASRVWIVYIQARPPPRIPVPAAAPRLQAALWHLRGTSSLGLISYPQTCPSVSPAAFKDSQLDMPGELRKLQAQLCAALAAAPAPNATAIVPADLQQLVRQQHGLLALLTASLPPCLLACAACIQVHALPLHLFKALRSPLPSPFPLPAAAAEPAVQRHAAQRRHRPGLPGPDPGAAAGRRAGRPGRPAGHPTGHQRHDSGAWNTVAEARSGGAVFECLRSCVPAARACARGAKPLRPN